MNICLLTPTFLPKIGGVETVVSSLAKHYQRMSHNPCVITQLPRRGKGTPNDDALPYPVVRYRRPWSFAWSPALRGIYRTLQAAHRKYAFDVIHCHLVYPVGYVAMAFAQKHDIPVVITAHGSDVRPTSRYRQRDLVWNRIVSSLQRCNLVTAISTHMNDVLAGIVEHDDAIQLIPNGVDADELTDPVAYDRHWPVDADKPFILYIGGLKRQKGVDLLLEAAKTIHDRGHTQTDIIVAGDGHERSRLEAFVHDNDLSQTVNFLGTVTGDLKRYLLQNCRYVVMPSRAESMGIVAIEALTCGKPVVAAAVGGLTDTVIDGITGKLAPPENAAALGDAMLAMESANIDAMESGARQHAENYTWPAIAKQYLNAYQSVMNNGKTTLTGTRNDRRSPSVPADERAAMAPARAKV